MKIKDLPKSDRPREKLIAKGAENLKDSELLAILLRTGTMGKNVIEIASQILTKHSKKRLLQMTYDDLSKISGIDSAKATTLLAAFELSKRALEVNDTNMTRIWNKHKQSNTTLKRKVFVAMSGGVDSSVAAMLFKKEGFRVVGVYFKPWSPSPLDARGGQGGYCNWQQDRLDAMRVAAKLGIEFKTWDFSKEYGKEVAQYMIDGYRAGITPNPDVICNKEIKFGLFLKKALAEGADFIATGHYARCEASGSTKSQNPNFKLLKAKDTNKDQTYFLWTLTQEQLKHILFPIGEYTKPQVRAMAKKFGLPTFDKKDSQGVCFVGELDMRDFLKEYIKPEPGSIMFEGKVIGAHQGAAYYTIGQRHGLNITIGGGPYYVARKESNVLYVEKSKIKSQELKISEVNWIGKKPKFPLKTNVKIRYRTQEIPVVIDSRYTLHATRPFTAAAPGQSAVIYRGQEVLGGGILQSSRSAS